jgi:hypothetical protein
LQRWGSPPSVEPEQQTAAQGNEKECANMRHQASLAVGTTTR